MMPRLLEKAFDHRRHADIGNDRTSSLEHDAGPADSPLHGSICRAVDGPQPGQLDLRRIAVWARTVIATSKTLRRRFLQPWPGPNHPARHAASCCNMRWQTQFSLARAASMVTPLISRSTERRAGEPSVSSSNSGLGMPNRTANWAARDSIWARSIAHRHAAPSNSSKCHVEGGSTGRGFHGPPTNLLHVEPSHHPL